MLRNLKLVWAAIFFALPAFIFNPACAAQDGEQILIYDVYASGIHGLEAELILDQNPSAKTYDISLYAHTRGFLGKLVPWDGVFKSSGWDLKNGMRPQMHQSIGTWREETETKTYRYNKDGSFDGLIIQDHDKPEVRKNIPPELARDTVDVLTATVETMRQMRDGETCESTADVFDGKRRFAMTFNYIQDDAPRASQYNIMQGVTQKCTVEVEPLAGRWHEKPRGWMSIQEQGRSKGTMPTIWFTQIEEGGLYVPGKVMVKTDYGTLMLHLSEYKSADTHLIADKRK